MNRAWAGLTITALVASLNPSPSLDAQKSQRVRNTFAPEIVTVVSIIPAQQLDTVGPLLAEDPRLLAKLEALLPPATDLQQAAEGFGRLDQFFTAVHVTRNLNIPLDHLKTQMEGPPAKNLAGAIAALNPHVYAPGEVRKAQAQAKADLPKTRTGRR